MLDALRACGCIVIHRSPAGEAPFRISFLTPWGERMGIVAYAFLANNRKTRNRPSDEHRFQIKYGPRTGRLHHLWQDPFGIYTTLCLGIDVKTGFFVAVDPVLNSPTLFYISKEFKQAHADKILSRGWHTWVRSVRPGTRRRDELAPEEERFEQGHEVLVGGKPEHFLRYVMFEREALGEDQGHRQLLAEQYPLTSAEGLSAVGSARAGSLLSPTRLHDLERELALGAEELMELISHAPRLKMAVRGWAAERHLRHHLERLPEVSAVTPIEADGRPDFEVALHGAKRKILVECKNVLRVTDAAGNPRLDFMRTRASKSDPCSRYYGPREFDVVAACLHARTEAWEFAARRTADMQTHATCTGKLSHRVVVDGAWERELGKVLLAAAA